MKSKENLNSFTAYCVTHPEERFWQALRNWSEYGFIFGSNKSAFTVDDFDVSDLEDTFYKD